MQKAHFEYLFTTYYPALCIYAESIVHDFPEAEDLVENVFIKLLTNNADPAVLQWGSYLYRAVRNACINHLHQKGKYADLDTVPIEELPADEDTIDAEQLKMEVYRELARAMEQLAPQSGRIIKMAYVEGLPSKEIARRLNITVSTVDNSKAKAIIRLRKLLTKKALLILLGGL